MHKKYAEKSRQVIELSIFYLHKGLKDIKRTKKIYCQAGFYSIIGKIKTNDLIYLT